jgi:hypothetical protein
VSARSATRDTRALGDLMQPLLFVAESNAAATREMTGQIESAAEAMSSAREGTEALSGTAERLRELISYFRLTEARRQSVNIPVSARSAAWTGQRTARIVDLSATGARIDGLEAPSGSELLVSFTQADGARVRRSARVMRCDASEAGPWVGIAFIDARPTSALAA